MNTEEQQRQYWQNKHVPYADPVCNFHLTEMERYKGANRNINLLAFAACRQQWEEKVKWCPAPTLCATKDISSKYYRVFPAAVEVIDLTEDD
jgi:hypothetical protein